MQIWLTAMYQNPRLIQHFWSNKPSQHFQQNILFTPIFLLFPKSIFFIKFLLKTCWICFFLIFSDSSRQVLATHCTNDVFLKPRLVLLPMTPCSNHPRTHPANKGNNFSILILQLICPSNNWGSPLSVPVLYGSFKAVTPVLTISSQNWP